MRYDKYIKLNKPNIMNMNRKRIIFIYYLFIIYNLIEKIHSIHDNLNKRSSKKISWDDLHFIIEAKHPDEFKTALNSNEPPNIHRQSATERVNNGNIIDFLPLDYKNVTNDEELINNNKETSPNKTNVKTKIEQNKNNLSAGPIFDINQSITTEKTNYVYNTKKDYDVQFIDIINIDNDEFNNNTNIYSSAFSKNKSTSKPLNNITKEEFPYYSYSNITNLINSNKNHLKNITITTEENCLRNFNENSTNEYNETLYNCSLSSIEKSDNLTNFNESKIINTNENKILKDDKNIIENEENGLLDEEQTINNGSTLLSYGTMNIENNTTFYDEQNYNSSFQPIEFANDNEYNYATSVQPGESTNIHKYYGDPFYTIESAVFNDYDHFENTNLLSVRKCCNEFYFYNTEINDCEFTENSLEFKQKVQMLMNEEDKKNFAIWPERVICEYYPSPSIKSVYLNLTHQITSNGNLYDMETGEEFNKTNYCLELVGKTIDESDFKAAFCPSYEPIIVLNSTRKCCPLNEYFDQIEGKCIIRSETFTDYNTLISYFAGEADYYDLQIETELLECEGDLLLLTNQDVYLWNGDQLCSYENECYSISNYCIEDFWSIQEEYLKPRALVCSYSVFHKCCDFGKVGTENGNCIKYDSPSIYMLNLLQKMTPSIGFPEDNELPCESYLLEEVQKNVNWSISDNGDLLIEFDGRKSNTSTYCVDDYLNSKNEIMLRTYMCRQELEGIKPLRLIERTGYKEIGKCCPPGEVLEVSSKQKIKCVPKNFEIDMFTSIIPESKNKSKLIYAGYPSCEFTSKDYHKFSLEYTEIQHDHAQIDENLNLYVYTMDGKCTEKKTLIDINNFCLDFSFYLNENIVDVDTGKLTDPKILVLTCLEDWRELRESHKEKYPLSSGLLIISCIALLVTIINLAIVRVRRGLVTVKKVTTDFLNNFKI